MNKELNDRQQRFVEFVARGLSAQEAASKAGFAPSTARKASRLLRHSLVAPAIAQIRAEARKQSCYSVVEAMKEAEECLRFSKEHKQCMAYVRAVELRSRLSGLLIDKVEIVSVDLTKALAEAEQRVLGPIDVTPAGAASWKPRIAGDSNGQVANAEAGTR
ncbi:MAG: terminase small subunit [Pyrinomonadaceae bacterium]|nr:terminase small subunit [Pyrinomonadaceae bacterium]